MLKRSVNMYLYRVLRDFERPRHRGIRARNPNARYSISQHVEYGNKQLPAFSGTRYISCSSEYNVAYEFGLKAVRSGKCKSIRLCVLDRSGLEKDPFIRVFDLYKGPSAQKLSPKAKVYAKRYKEVVVEDFIPPCYVVDVKCFSFPNGNVGLSSRKSKEYLSSDSSIDDGLPKDDGKQILEEPRM
ncbi:uncharacterized protein LOC128239922 [Mya arenaria]|uniref:uncharacterized protein LOC128239922 n=1 Tax=Mya arenaria TaxID=6604 RepID=UPI0022DF9576|nr:uncharacterized protein LOC128239922 [Mya arenaria]